MRTKMEKYYAIVNIHDKNLYWDNGWGWIEVDDDSENTFSIFTELEKETFQLPIDGKWVEL
jgi:hypothetical protein